jgi:hypothetical protein
MYQLSKFDIIDRVDIDKLNELKLLYHDKLKYYMHIYTIDYLKCTGKTIDESEIIKYSNQIKDSYFESAVFAEDLEDYLIDEIDNPFSTWTADTFGCYTQVFSDFFEKYDLYGERDNKGEYNITREKRKFVESVINERAEEQDGGDDVKRTWGFARDNINGDYDSQYSDYISESDE